VHDILAEIGALPGVVAAANPSGVAHYVSRSGKPYRVTYGFPGGEGGPDVLVVARGMLLGIECKTGKATTTKEQRACHAALRAVGVVVHVVRTVEEARAALLAVVEGCP
jgi:hypothetical protein